MSPLDLHRYIIAFYWAFTTLTTVGYGGADDAPAAHVAAPVSRADVFLPSADVTASTFPEMVYSVFAMVIGTMVFGLIIGSLTSIIVDSDPVQETLHPSQDPVNSLKPVLCSVAPCPAPCGCLLPPCCLPTCPCLLPAAVCTPLLLIRK